MTWRATANPERFDEAMEWFEERVPIERDRLDKLTAEQRAQAFTIAGVNQLSVVQDVLDSLKRAVAEGKPVQDFTKEMKAKLNGSWGKATSHKLHVIFVTNVQTSYNAGRYTQMTDEDVLATRPFWVYDAVLDHRTSAICNSLSGLTLPADDPGWSGRYPPNHHLCRSGIRSVSRRAGEKRGVTKEIPQPDISVGFGKVPGGEPWKPSKSDYTPKAWSTYQKKQKDLRS